MPGPEWGQLPNASSGMRYILIRASRYKMYRPLRNALGSCPHSDPTAACSKYDSQTYTGADKIWWLGFAEPLYKEAGAKAPASLNFLLDKVRDQGIEPPCSGNTGPVLDLVFRTFRRPGNPLIRSSEGAG